MSLSLAAVPQAAPVHVSNTLCLAVSSFHTCSLAPDPLTCWHVTLGGSDEVFFLLGHNPANFQGPALV